MGPKRWIALVVVALMALLGLAGSAQSSRGSGPVATIACQEIAPGVCKESGKVQMPAHGVATQATDTVPGTASRASLFVQPLSKSDLGAFDGIWEDVVNGYPKLGKITSTPLRRALTCVVLAHSVSALAKLQGIQTRGTVAGDPSLGEAFLRTCIQMTVLAQQAAGSAAASSVSAGCATASVSVPILISRTGGGYVIKLNGVTSKPAGRGPLAVSCQAKGNGIQIGIRSRSKRRKLRQVVGPHLMLGYANSTDRSLTINTTFTLAR